MKKIVIEVIAALLVLLFLYAGISRFLTFKVFVDEINNQPFPNWLTPYLAVGIPTMEILIAVALLFERTRKAGFYGSVFLLSVLSIYGALVWFGAFAYVPCSCAGMVKHLNWGQHLLLTLGFLVLSAVGITLNKRMRTTTFTGGQAVQA